VRLPFCDKIALSTLTLTFRVSALIFDCSFLLDYVPVTRNSTPTALRADDRVVVFQFEV
jgi:hypothetical protein